MSKHTPGPWIAEWRTNAYAEILAPNEIGYAAKLICSTAMVNAEANARLIAAAPDLLAACQAMAEWDAAENQLPPYDSDNGASFDQCMALCRDAFDKARAAIAKATGEQS